MRIVIKQIERVEIQSDRSFDEVLAGIEKFISRPDMPALSRAMEAASSLDALRGLVQGAVGRADLMEFLRLDLGRMLRKDSSIRPYNIVRIIAGNPLIMSRMIRDVPDAGSYAPITILVYERGGSVTLCYDTISSALAEYGSPKALRVAQDLDDKVISLLANAAG